MKKMFFVLVAALAAVSLASCRNDELTEVNDRFEELRIAEEKTETESRKRGEYESLKEYLDRIRGTGPKKKE